MSGGRLRFYVESKPTIGVVTIKGKRGKDKEWLEQKGCNTFLKKSLKSQNVKEMMITHIAELYGLQYTQEEHVKELKDELLSRVNDFDILSRKYAYINDKLGVEEEAKRRTLIRYINAVKASVSLGEPGSEKDRDEVGRIGAGKVYLPEVS